MLARLQPLDSEIPLAVGSHVQDRTLGALAILSGKDLNERWWRRAVVAIQDAPREETAQ